MTQQLTPIDILNLRFRRRLRGYSVAEVDAFMQKAAASLEHVLTECATLRERNATLEREVAHFRTLETTLRDALVLAQKAADETRAAAHLQAEAHLQSAQARAAELDLRTQERSQELRQSLDQLQLERKRIALDLRARLNAHLSWLDAELQAEPNPPAPFPAARFASLKEGGETLTPGPSPTLRERGEAELAFPLSHSVGEGGRGGEGLGAGGLGSGEAGNGTGELNSPTYAIVDAPPPSSTNLESK